MLANAVSSAVERLYAGNRVADDSNAVTRASRVDGVQRVRPISEGDNKPDTRADRESQQQRQALTRGVKAVFEAGTTTVGAGLVAPEVEARATEETRRTDAEAQDRAPKVQDLPPDPVLEEAIQRFIKTMFRSLADAEEAGLLPSETGPAEASAKVGSARVAGIALSGRSALSARIEALAQRLAQSPFAAPTALDIGGDGGATSTPTADAIPGTNALVPVSTQGRRASEVGAGMDQAFAEVMQVLRGNLGGADPNPADQRGELVSLMKRLAAAVQGSPPHDPGLLPTRGGLLSERA